MVKAPLLHKCPQCRSLECGPVRCRFTMTEHRNAAPQAADGRASVKPLIDNALASGETGSPADAAPIGYEAAYIDGPLT